MHLELDEHEDEMDSEELLKLGGDRLEFRSVGIDIGSSTSHFMFSRLVLARRGREYFSGYTVVEREIIYRSPVILTPFNRNHSLVDVSRLRDFINQGYSEAGLAPGQIDTGAVITTGEAAKKENTSAIINLLAEDAGKFVCAAAGPNLEAVLAAHGSGAVKESMKHHERGHETLLNVDVGGGTSKIALVKEGQVTETCAINVGSRLVAWDEDGMLIRVEEAGARVASSLGIAAEVGRRLNGQEKEQLAEKLAELLFEVLQQKPLSELAQALMITSGFSDHEPVDTVVYSGGVSEFIYHQEDRSFGDLGPLLGRAVRARHDQWGKSLGFPRERICATVIGASQYTVQVSGNTIYLSHPEFLPLRNLPVVKLSSFQTRVTRKDVAAAIQQRLRLLDLTEGSERVALAICWDQEPEYGRLVELAEGIKMAFPETISAGLPIVVIFDSDVGKLVGHLLAGCGVSHLVSVDNINVGQLSYIDVGCQLSTTNAVPVTVKSLIFR